MKVRFEMAGYIAAGILALLIALFIFSLGIQSANEENNELRRQIDELIETKSELISTNAQLRAKVVALGGAGTAVITVPENKPEEKAVTVTDAALDEPKITKKTAVPEYSKERLPQDEMTNFFSYETYNNFNEKSEHYRLQQLCHTESGTGLRYYYDGAEEYYTVALGGAYGTTIGDAWRVTLKCGSVFNIILGDTKHSVVDPDPFDFGDPCVNYDKQDCISVIEFIVDIDEVPRSVCDPTFGSGTFTTLEMFGGQYGDGGNIVKIEYLGRRWEA